MRLVLLLLVIGRLSWALDCSRDCRGAKDRSEQIERDIQRLSEIKTANQIFVAALDPTDESRRLKANSNLKIAERRILEATRERDALNLIRNAWNCEKCED